MCVRQNLRTKRRWIHLEWEGQAQNAKMRGTLGTLGILSLFLGKYEQFSRVPKDANGTLCGHPRSKFGRNLHALHPQAEPEDEIESWREKAAPLEPLGNPPGVLRCFQEAHVELLEPLAKNTGDLDVFDGK
jgi:hypothetical protein